MDAKHPRLAPDDLDPAGVVAPRVAGRGRPGVEQRSERAGPDAAVRRKAVDPGPGEPFCAGTLAARRGRAGEAHREPGRRLDTPRQHRCRADSRERQGHRVPAPGTRAGSAAGGTPSRRTSPSQGRRSITRIALKRGPGGAGLSASSVRAVSSVSCRASSQGAPPQPCSRGRADERGGELARDRHEPQNCGPAAVRLGFRKSGTPCSGHCCGTSRGSSKGRQERPHKKACQQIIK